MFGLTLLGVASAALLVTAGRVPLGAATSQSLLAVIGCFALGSGQARPVRLRSSEGIPQIDHGPLERHHATTVFDILLVDLLRLGDHLRVEHGALRTPRTTIDRDQ